MSEQYIVKTQFGLEEVLAAELRELGFNEVSILNRAVAFTSDMRGLYKANLGVRTGLKILKPLFEFQAFTEHELYEGMRKFPWEELIGVEQTFAIQSVVNSEFFNHSKYVALKSKDAIVDLIRDKKGKRPNVDPEKPDFLIHLNVNMQKVSVSLDSSGEPLFKRGYRTNTVTAPINECLAAGMIGLTGWTGDTPFYDGMCGSGTLLIEAALKAGNIAPNFNRRDFGFTTWPDFNRKLLEEVREELRAAEKNDLPPIVGADVSNMAVAIAKENVENAGFGEKITVERRPFSRFSPEPEHKNGVLVLNPPYGERLESDDIVALYKSIGDQLKKNFAGFQAWIISSDLEAIKFIGLRPERKIALYNGQLACKFHKFSLYEGTKKIHKLIGNDKEPGDI